MLVLSNEEIARLLSMEERSPTSRPGAYYGFKHMGGAWPAQRVQALRINSDIITHPSIGGKPRRVKQPLAGGRWVGLVLLFSTETGALLAMFPDGVLQRMRVGAASGLALKHLARENVSTLALIGTGWQAGAQLMAARAVRSFREVRVYSPRAESRAAFASEFKEVKTVDTIQSCVEGAEVILAATSSMVRIIEPRWLRPGMHIGCIKSQEIDAEVLERCDRVFVHDRQQAKQLNNVMAGTPNVQKEHEEGWWKDAARGGRYPDLGELLADTAPARQSEKEITCFANNVGTGLQFAAAGIAVVHRAREMGIGTELPDDWFSENVHP